MTLPKPWQVGQAPNGLLNENSRGCGSSYRMWHRRHSNRSLNWWTTGGSASDARQLDRERGAAALAIGGLDRVGQPRLRLVVHRPRGRRRPRASSGCPARRRPRLRGSRPGRPPAGAGTRAWPGSAASRAADRCARPRRSSASDRLAVFQIGWRRRVGHAHDGHLEADEQPRARAAAPPGAARRPRPSRARPRCRTLRQNVCPTRAQSRRM